MPSSGDRTGKRDARLALVYLEAARRALGPKRPAAMPDLEMMSPVSFLIAHAVELALGALLRASGSRGERESNHDLADRLSRVEELGFAVPARFQSYIRLNNLAHKSHQFRYARADEEPFVDAWQALEIVKPVIELIERDVAGRVRL